MMSGWRLTSARPRDGVIHRVEAAKGPFGYLKNRHRTFPPSHHRPDISHLLLTRVAAPRSGFPPRSPLLLITFFLWSKNTKSGDREGATAVRTPLVKVTGGREGARSQLFLFLVWNPDESFAVFLRSCVLVPSPRW